MGKVFWFKQNRKGYVLVYVIVALSLLMGIFLLSFKIELMKKSYNDISISAQILKNSFEREREYLLSKVSKYIKESLGDKDSNENEVHDILSKLRKIEFNSSYLEYRKNDKKLVLNLINEKGERKVEYYNYKISSEFSKVIFVNTTP